MKKMKNINRTINIFILNCFAILLFLSAKSQVNDEVRFKKIGVIQKEILLFKFMKYEKINNQIYTRDPIYMTPKDINLTSENNICSSFSWVILMNKTRYHRLAWYINNEDSINSMTDRASILSCIEMSRNQSLNIFESPFQEYKLMFDQSTSYLLNRDVMLFCKRIKIQGVLIYSSNIGSTNFYTGYASWDNLTGANCLADNTYLFITQVSEQSDVPNDLVKKVFKNIKINKYKVNYRGEG